jgi:hypothetical protein
MTFLIVDAPRQWALRMLSGSLRTSSPSLVRISKA